MSSDKKKNALLTSSRSVPKKRGNRARWASGVIFLVTASLVLAFGYSSPNEYEFERVSRSKERNSTSKCFTKKETITLSNVLGAVLSLFGVVLGTLVDRLSHVAEEYRHREQRYDGSWKKMLKACFSGIRWSPVILLIILSTISLIVLIIVRQKAGKPRFEIQHLIYILSGVGVGPLVMQLLNLNTQSEIHISTILEENQTNVANGLAWYYYINYLQLALPLFKEAANSSNTKLVLLLPFDCIVNDNLSEIDCKIVKLGKTGNDGDTWRFTIYELTVDSEKYELAIQYVKEPLCTLKEMCRLSDGKAVTRKHLKQHVKFLHSTLLKILSHENLKELNEACVFVPIGYKTLNDLKNGELAKRIVDKVEKSYDKNDSVDRSPGFFTAEASKHTDDGDEMAEASNNEGESPGDGKMQETQMAFGARNDSQMVQEYGVS